MGLADDIAALRAAWAAGVTQIRYSDGRSVTYASLRELREVIDRMEAEQAARMARRVKVGRVRF